jgi:hypothetical protein
METNPTAKGKTTPLPGVSFAPSGVTNRPVGSIHQGRPHLIGDDDGNSYLVIPCRHMEVTVAFGSELEDMEFLVKQLQEHIEEVKEMQS